MPAVENFHQKTTAAEEVLKGGNLDEAFTLFRQLLDSTQDKVSEDALKARETALLKLGHIFQKQGRAQDMATLIRGSKTALNGSTKAKTAKIGKLDDEESPLRQLIDHFSEIPNSLPLQVEVCKELIAWTVEENRFFLKQSLETRLAALYLDNRMYSDALSLIATLLKELKRLDDKLVLMEVQLLESRTYHALRNLPKARAALTSARTSANAIYCPPMLQAALDLQSGILHAEDKDYNTAYSYFYETMEGYSSQEDPRAALGLKYMLLCKIMLNAIEDIQSILVGKVALRHQGAAVDAMKAVASAYKNRSLVDFEMALSLHKDQLQNDPIIRHHLQALYDSLLEQNLCRIIEPYSRVQITHVADLVKLPAQQVEVKLSQMILDKKFHGILDQSNGTLHVFEEPTVDKTYEYGLETIKHLSNVVDSLYEKARKL